MPRSPSAVFSSLPSLPSRTDIVNALSSLRKRVSDFVFSKWGVALALLSVAVGVRFGSGVGASVGALGLVLGLAVQWMRSPSASKPRGAAAVNPKDLDQLLRQINDETSEAGKVGALQRMSDSDVVYLIDQMIYGESNEPLLHLISVARPSFSRSSFPMLLFKASAIGSERTVNELLKRLPADSTLDTIDQAVRSAENPALGLRILRAFLNECPNAARPLQEAIDLSFEYTQKHRDRELSEKLLQMGVSQAVAERHGIELVNAAPAPVPSSEL